MVGAAVEILRINVGIDGVRHILSDGCDEFDVCQSHRTCGLRRPFTRHQLAACCSNTLSLGHGVLRGLGQGRRRGGCLSPACIFCTREIMPKQGKSVHKKRGRPPGRRYGETIPVRLSSALKDQVDAWTEKQPDAPSRSEALRRLVELGLAAKGKKWRP